MAKELPYFKFFPGEWVTGDITLCSMEAQGIFINICSFYWSKGCSMTLANAKQRYNNCLANLNELLEQNILKVDSEENIIINYLDEQMNEFMDVSGKRAIAGAKGGKAKAKQMLSKTLAKSSNKEKIREDKEKIREDKIPTYDEFKNYALENEPNINLKSLELKYKAWCENNWKDGNNKPIKNWKSKLLNTIPHLGKNKIKSTINTVWDEKNR